MSGREVVQVARTLAVQCGMFYTCHFIGGVFSPTWRRRHFHGRNGPHMRKKNGKNGNNGRDKPVAKSAVRSAVRNSSIPKSISRPPQYAASSQQQRPGGRPITYEMIAKLAH